MGLWSNYNSVYDNNKLSQAKYAEIFQCPREQMTLGSQVPGPNPHLLQSDIHPDKQCQASHLEFFHSW